jgi:transposase
VAASTAIGWIARLCVEGERHSRRQGRPCGSKLDPHRDFLLSRLKHEPDMTIQKMQELLSEERGLRAAASTIWTFLNRAGQKKKSVHASEQERPDVQEKREAWFEGQLDLDPSKLVFVDETWATTKLENTIRSDPCPRDADIQSLARETLKALSPVLLSPAN